MKERKKYFFFFFSLKLHFIHSSSSFLFPVTKGCMYMYHLDPHSAIDSIFQYGFLLWWVTFPVIPQWCCFGQEMCILFHCYSLYGREILRSCNTCDGWNFGLQGKSWPWSAEERKYFCDFCCRKVTWSFPASFMVDLHWQHNWGICFCDSSAVLLHAGLKMTT